ncbi:hypothetical protein IT398_02250 [Candidatus Nomurabacteria bacterium]|nr:hypothetical protein [Candidatus Nomurabacteria bacterium]
MVYPFKYPYHYTAKVVEGWDSSAIGVYYCGMLTTDGKLTILYIGKGTSDGGIRVRLLDHLRDDYWPDATHFGYHRCDTVAEAERHEAEEIKKYQPKYNKVGK